MKQYFVVFNYTIRNRRYEIEKKTESAILNFTGSDPLDHRHLRQNIYDQLRDPINNSSAGDFLLSIDLITTMNPL